MEVLLPPPRPAGRLQIITHDLVDNDGVLACSACRRTAASAGSRANLMAARCVPWLPAQAGPMREQTRVHPSHRVYCSDPVLWCSVCGWHAEQAMRKLADPCPGVATAWGRRAISCFRRGVHPQTRRVLGAPVLTAA